MSSNNFKESSETLRLAIFDLDGTLTAIRSPFRFISKALGVEKEAKRIYQGFLNGEIAYEDWGMLEVALWRGLPESQFIEILRTIPYRPGALDFVQYLKNMGVIVALVSAGFEQHVKARASELNAIPYKFTQVEVLNGSLTGIFISNLNKQSKRDLVIELQNQYSAGPEETLAAGDSLGDIAMFLDVGFSIAVDPETPEVSKAASIVLPNNNWKYALKIIKDNRPSWLAS